MDLLTHLVLENPTTLLVLLIITTIIMGMLWRRSGSSRCRFAAGACVAAGFLVLLVAYLVETDRERLQRTLATMGEAADHGRAEVFIERLSPAFRTGSLDKAGMAGIVRRGLAVVRVKADRPVIVMGDGRATVTQSYRFRSVPEAGAALPPAYQRIVWEGAFRREADGEWRLTAAKAVHPREMLPEEAARHLSRLR